MAGAVISRVRVAAGHDGTAELIVTLVHGNGGESHVSLDQIAAAALLAACGTSALEELAGHDWQHVQAALAVSWNRFNPAAVVPPVRGTEENGG